MGQVVMNAGWQEQVIQCARPCIEELAQRMKAGAEADCPVAVCGDPHPPGELKASIYVNVDADCHIYLGATAFYACYVELGTRPHVITSHSGRQLHNHCTGQFFGKTVHHPGATPSPFLRPQCYKDWGDLSKPRVVRDLGHHWECSECKVDGPAPTAAQRKNRVYEEAIYAWKHNSTGIRAAMMEISAGRVCTGSEVDCRDARAIIEHFKTGTTSAPTLYRGFNFTPRQAEKFLANKKVGSVFTDPVSSYSRDPRVAEGFAKGDLSLSSTEGKTVHVGFRLKGAKSVNIETVANTGFDFEKEHLLATGKFKVIARRENIDEAGHTEVEIDIEQVKTATPKVSVKDNFALNIKKHEATQKKLTTHDNLKLTLANKKAALESSSHTYVNSAGKVMPVTSEMREAFGLATQKKHEAEQKKQKKAQKQALAAQKKAQKQAFAALLKGAPPKAPHTAKSLNAAVNRLLRADAVAAGASGYRKNDGTWVRFGRRGRSGTGGSSGARVVSRGSSGARSGRLFFWIAGGILRFGVNGLQVVIRLTMTAVQAASKQPAVTSPVTGPAAAPAPAPPPTTGGP